MGGNTSSCRNPTVVPTYEEEADQKTLLQRHKVLNELKKPKKLTIPDDNKKEEPKPTTPLLTYSRYKPKRKQKKNKTKFEIYHEDGLITSV